MKWEATNKAREFQRRWQRRWKRSHFRHHISRWLIGLALAYFIVHSVAFAVRTYLETQ